MMSYWFWINYIYNRHAAWHVTLVLITCNQLVQKEFCLVATRKIHIKKSPTEHHIKGKPKKKKSQVFSNFRLFQKPHLPSPERSSERLVDYMLWMWLISRLLLSKRKALTSSEARGGGGGVAKSLLRFVKAVLIAPSCCLCGFCGDMLLHWLSQVCLALACSRADQMDRPNARVHVHLYLHLHMDCFVTLTYAN